MVQLVARAEAQAPTQPVAISVGGLTKAFYDPRTERITVAIRNIDLTIGRGEFVCIVGPSGCGKTTILRILAGLETALDGEVELVSDQPPGMVFQEASVLPWLTVEQNVGFPLAIRHVRRAARKARVDELLELTQLSDFRNALPQQLSGGMRQRVAVARALVDDRDILLMDEPFGSLDEQTRLGLQQELLRIWEASRKTVLFITHSVDEALTLADKVIVMSPRPGRILAEIPIPFERPREVVALRRDRRFWDLTYDVWRLLGADAKGHVRG